MSKHGKFNEFFELAKDENVWTNILKQHEEMAHTNPPDEDNEFELDRYFISFVSFENEGKKKKKKTHTHTGPSIRYRIIKT